MHREMFFTCPEPGTLRADGAMIFYNCVMTCAMGEFVVGETVANINLYYDAGTMLLYTGGFTYLFKIEAVLQG